MKHLLSVTTTLLLLCTLRPSYAHQQLDLYLDQGMTQCELADAAGLQTIHVFLNGPEVANAVVFSAPRPSCWVGATWVGDALPGPRGTIGNSQAGYLVPLFVPGFYECRTPPVLVCSMLFVSTGTSLPCCTISVAPITQHVGSFLPLSYQDCVFREVPLAIGQAVAINANDSCSCRQALATERTTWGRVKSLYR